MTLSRNLLWVSISSIFRSQSIMNCLKSLPIWSIFYHIWLIYSFVFNWLLVRLSFFPNIVWHFAFFLLYLFPWSIFILHILFLINRSILCIIHCCVPNIFSKFVIGLFYLCYSLLNKNILSKYQDILNPCYPSLGSEVHIMLRKNISTWIL